MWNACLFAEMTLVYMWKKKKKSTKVVKHTPWLDLWIQKSQDQLLCPQDYFHIHLMIYMLITAI